MDSQISAICAVGVFFIFLNRFRTFFRLFSDCLGGKLCRFVYIFKHSSMNWISESRYFQFETLYAEEILKWVISLISCKIHDVCGFSELIIITRKYFSLNCWSIVGNAIDNFSESVHHFSYLWNLFWSNLINGI